MTKSEILNKISTLETAKAEFTKSVSDCIEKLKSAKSSIKGLSKDLKTSDTVLQSGLKPGLAASNDAINTAITNIILNMLLKNRTYMYCIMENTILTTL